MHHVHRCLRVADISTGTRNRSASGPESSWWSRPRIVRGRNGLVRTDRRGGVRGPASRSEIAAAPSSAAGREDGGGVRFQTTVRTVERVPTRVRPNGVYRSRGSSTRPERRTVTSSARRSPRGSLVRWRRLRCHGRQTRRLRRPRDRRVQELRPDGRARRPTHAGAVA